MVTTTPQQATQGQTAGGAAASSYSTFVQVRSRYPPLPLSRRTVGPSAQHSGLSTGWLSNITLPSGCACAVLNLRNCTWARVLGDEEEV